MMTSSTSLASTPTWASRSAGLVFTSRPRLLADLGVEAGVDHDRLAADHPVAALVERDRHPDEIVHREVGVVRVRRDLHFPSLARQVGVLDRMHLVDGRRTHLCFLPDGSLRRRVASARGSRAIVASMARMDLLARRISTPVCTADRPVAVRLIRKESVHVRRPSWRLSATPPPSDTVSKPTSSRPSCRARSSCSPSAASCRRASSPRRSTMRSRVEIEVEGLAQRDRRACRPLASPRSSACARSSS